MATAFAVYKIARCRRVILQVDACHHSKVYPTREQIHEEFASRESEGGMKVALYFRVSTSEQSNEPQRLELLEYCRRRGWTDVREYADKMSGTKFTRIGLDSMMADVRKGRLNVVCCVKLDRLGRSLPHLAQIFGELATHNVALISTTQGIDTTDQNPCGRLIMGILATIADFELSLIQERTKAGLAAARARGQKLGRPRMQMTPRMHGILEAWLETPNADRNYSELAVALGCSVGKAHALAKGGR